MIKDTAMRIYGTLISWNSVRGEGFIATPKHQQEILVISACFPQDGTPPRIGEALLFEVEKGADGKLRAEKIQRPGANNKPHYSFSSKNSMGYGIPLVLVIGIIVGFQFLNSNKHISALESQATKNPVTVRESNFTCDGRTHCSHMISCEEAYFFLSNCPNTKMDGDGDGIPCERQWCR